MTTPLHPHAHLASNLGIAGSIVAMISTLGAIIGGLFIFIATLLFANSDFLTWLEPFMYAEDYTILANFIQLNGEFFQFILITTAMFFIAIGAIYLFFEVKMLHYAQTYRREISIKQTTYMIIFAVFLLFSGRLLSGGLLLTSGILAYRDLTK